MDSWQICRGPTASIELAEAGIKVMLPQNATVFLAFSEVFHWDDVVVKDDGDLAGENRSVFLRLVPVELDRISEFFRENLQDLQDFAWVDTSGHLRQPAFV